MTTDPTSAEVHGSVLFSAVLSRDLLSGPRDLLAISRLREGVQVRVLGLDADHVARLADQAGPLPPIVVRAGTLVVIDGLHRLEAARLRGETWIDSLVVDVTEEEALLLAVELNSRHGLPLSRSDRRAAVARTLRSRAEWSDRRIAMLTGVSPKTVGALRQRMSEEIPHSNTRVGRDGRLWRADIGARREEVVRVLESQPQASLRDVAAITGVAASTVRHLRRSVIEGCDDPPAQVAADAAARPDHSGVSEDSRGQGRGAGRSGGAAGDGDARRQRPGDEPATGGAKRLPPTQGRRVTGNDDVVDVVAEIARLRDDPSLRGSVGGRSLLRLLWMTMQELAVLDALLLAVPPHQASTVESLARECGSAWLGLADAVLRETRATTT